MNKLCKGCFNYFTYYEDYPCYICNRRETALVDNKDMYRKGCTIIKE